MNETQTLLAETCHRLFGDLVTADSLRAAEAGEWPADLWVALEENDLTRPLVPEDHGGAGLGWQDVYPILHAAGYHAAPVPLAETLAASWLLAQAGMAVPEGVITLADGGTVLKRTSGDRAWHASGEFDHVPWGSFAGHLLAFAKRSGDGYFALIDRESVEVSPDKNIGRDPRVAVKVVEITPVAVAGVPAKLSFDTVRYAGALVRSVQMAGAIAAVLDLCVEYAGDRVQFGRPLAKFQAIQQQLAILAAEAAAAQIAAQHACRAVDVLSSTVDAHREICTAKIRTGEAAGKVAAIGHQVHGAIGFTEEYRLHHLTRRLWSWRSEFGAEASWASHLGVSATSSYSGDDRFWQFVTRQPTKRKKAET